MNDGVMLNAYPDSMGGTLSDIVRLLEKPELAGAFSSFYILPSVFTTDLDRGFSVISYDLDRTMTAPGDMERLRALGLDLKLDFILNHLSVQSPQFQDMLAKGEASAYKDFFINWNRFWEGKGQMTAEGYIHRYTADNGQEIYFASSEREALVSYDDVNFDEHPDLAVVTALGASNAFYEFYLWNGSEYEYAERWTSDIINYELVDGKYLVSRSNDGNAGALFHAQICVWDGNVLKVIRTMVSEEETCTVWEGRIMTETMNLDRLHVIVREMDGLAGASTVLWEKTYESLPEAPGVFEEMNAHLWDGLRD